MDEPTIMLNHASRFLDSARANFERGEPYYPIAFDEARHSLEVAGKALLHHKNGSYPRTHRIGGILAHEGLIPRAINIQILNRVLDHPTRGAYGFTEEFTTDETHEIIELAQIMLDAGRKWPDFSFHPPFVDDF